MRQQIRKLLNDGNISNGDIGLFYSAVRLFFTTAATYALKNLPIEDEILFNAQCVNLGQRSTSTVTRVMYFIDRYSVIGILYSFPIHHPLT